THQRRPHRDSADRAGGLAGCELCVRCYSGAAGDWLDYRGWGAESREVRTPGCFPGTDRGGGGVKASMDASTTSSRRPLFTLETAKDDVVAGLISSAVAIPLTMASGMFAFVSLGDEYFAYGAMAGLASAAIAGFVCVLLGGRSTRVSAPGGPTTFFLGLLLHSLLARAPMVAGKPDIAATLLVF